MGNFDEDTLSDKGRALEWVCRTPEEPKLPALSLDWSGVRIET